MDTTMARILQVVGDLYVENKLLREHLQELTLELRQTRQEIEKSEKEEDA